MPSFRTSKKLQHSAENMYKLVADVESYPQFVPLCETLVIRSIEEGDDQTVMVADMTVAYKLLRETFTSRVLLEPQTLSITTKAIDGPLSLMQNNWRFTSVSENSCSVDFSLDYEFRSRALQFLVGGLFDRVFSKYSVAFERRADEIYGTHSV